MTKTEYQREYRKKRLLLEPDYRKVEAQEYYQKHRERIDKRNRIWKLLNPDNVRAAYLQRTKDLRLKVLTYYSNGTLSCVRCGYNDIRALHLDHINDNGVEDRKAHGKSQQFLVYLIKSNYPSGYQVLCANCNTIKEIERRKSAGRG